MSEDHNDPNIEGSPMPIELSKKERHQAYWRANIRILSKLLVVWFIVSYGFGLICAPFLNQFKLLGTEFPLGFWFAQQGAIYVFVILIFIYIKMMDRLDAEYSVSEEE
jgi:putative solute:sodium symporter small subunit